MTKVLPDPEAVPLFLRLQVRWLVWGYAERGGKKTKVPYVASEEKRPASVSDPMTWRTFARALEVAEKAPWAAGVGVVLGEGLVGVDLDGVVEGGEFDPLAREVLERTTTYTELSPSGKGLHLLVFGEVESFRRGKVEVYSGGRYFTFTGRTLPGRREVLRDQAFLDWLEGRFKGEREKRPVASPKASFQGGPDDLVARVLSSRYAPLWTGNWQSMGYASQSEADLALAGYLVYLTGGDLDLADRLFRLSALYRPKWDEKRGALTYGERTLRRAAGIS